jgi:hypothetical protein
MSHREADRREPGSPSRSDLPVRHSSQRSQRSPLALLRGRRTRRSACAPLLRVGVGACRNVPIPPFPHAPVSHKPPCPTAEQTAAISRGGPPARHFSAEEWTHTPCPCTERTVACARGDPPSTGRSAVPERAQAAFPNVRRGERRASERAANAGRDTRVPEQRLTPCERKNQSVYCVSAECVE